MLSLCTRYFLGLYEQRHGCTLRGSELVIRRTSYFLFFSGTSWLVGSQFTGWQWKCRVLTTGPSENPQTSYFSYINRKCLKSGVIIWDLWKQSLRQLFWEFNFRKGSKWVVKQKSGKASTGTVIDQPPSQATRAWFRRPFWNSFRVVYLEDEMWKHSLIHLHFLLLKQDPISGWCI